METKLMLLICLACQCSKHTSSAQVCSQVQCTPVLEGRMCTSTDLQTCCLARCTFEQLGNARATYDIEEITLSPLGIANSCSGHLPIVTEDGYSRVKVVENPVGNTCPVEGTCNLYQCANVIGRQGNHVFINEDYVATIQTLTSTQSLSASFSTHSPAVQPTSTHFPVQGSLNAQQTNTHLFNYFPPMTNSVSHGQSMLVSPPQTPSPIVPDNDKKHYFYAMLGGALGAGLLCAIFIVLTITCLIFRCSRGAKSGDKSREVESDDNIYEEVPERAPQTSANSHYLEVLPINDYVQMSPQPIAPSLQQKLMSNGGGSPLWSFQPDTAGAFTTGDTHSTHAFLASTMSMDTPDAAAVGVTMTHQIASNLSTFGHHHFEGVDLDHEKGESSLEQSQEGAKVPQKRQLSLKPKSPKNVRVITASERIFQETNRAFLRNLSCEQVIKLLDSLGLDVYKPDFQQARVTGDVLVKFDERMLEEGMGVRSRSDRTKFMKLITGQYSAEELLFQGSSYAHDSY